MSETSYLNNSTTQSGVLERFQPHTATCYGKEFDGFLIGLLKQFRDTFFYALILQFLLVALMYNSVGKGIYWKVLFYASLAGVLGSIFENSTVAYVCQDSKKDVNVSKMYFYPLVVDEIFWIVSEYAIPYLNLIKMKAFARGKLNTIVRYTILALFIPFVIFRFIIGYTRMEKGYLTNNDIQRFHGYAFGVMAVADLICTFAILYFVKQNNSQAAASANLNHYVKHSSYTILVLVDVVSLLLSIINIINNISTKESPTLSALSVPLHCFKSSFVLILAIDALLFKYGANVVSVNESTSGNNSKNFSSSNHTLGGYKSLNFNNNSAAKTYKNGKPISNSYTIEMTNTGGIKTSASTNNFASNSKKANISNIVTYNYPPIEKDMYSTNKTSKNSNSPTFTPSKSIVKNYTNIQTNIQTNSMLFESPIENNNMYSKNFGFLQTPKNQY